MARRGRAPALQVLPSYTEEDLLKETGRLLQESKQLREQVATHWQIKPEQWQKTLADSADAVKQYTRWSVTGPAVEQMTKRPLPGDNSWKAAKQAMFAEAQASEPPPTTSVPVLPLGAAGSAGVAAAPAFEPVTPEPGMHMAVVQGAKVRADVSTTSQEMGALEDGQVIEVLEVRPTMEDSNQYRVRFDDGHGLAGWISSATKSTGRPVLRQLAEPLGVRRGAICQVKFEKAMVREGFPMESPKAGFLEQGDFIEVVDARVNEQNQVRVAFELEDAGHPHWVSMVATSGEVLLEALPEDWEGLAQDMDGDGVVDAEEQAQWAQYGAADIDGDGRVTQEEMRQFARQSASQHQHAHGAVQVHGDGDDVYD